MKSLSIIIPFYNETAYLRDAIASVIAQRIDEIEIIVVNDNPKDFPPAALEALTNGLPVTLLHHTENLGLSAARNTGMNATTGDVIGFLDADDYYVSDGLAKQLHLADKTNADITHACTYLGKVGSSATTLLRRCPPP